MVLNLFMYTVVTQDVWYMYVTCMYMYIVYGIYGIHCARHTMYSIMTYMFICIVVCHSTHVVSAHVVSAHVVSAHAVSAHVVSAHVVSAHGGV